MTIYIFSLQKKELSSSSELPLNKPLDLKSALVFGALYMVILLVVSYANENLGESGILISSAIAGISDIDAITISVAKLSGNPLSINLAGMAILIASISNTLIKMGIGIYAGSSALRRHLYLGYGVVFVAALLALIVFL